MLETPLVCRRAVLSWPPVGFEGDATIKTARASVKQSLAWYFEHREDLYQAHPNAWVVIWDCGIVAARKTQAAAQDYVHRKGLVKAIILHLRTSLRLITEA